MHPVIFGTDFFGLLSEPWELHTYGMFIALGFVAAMVLAKRQGELEGEDPDRIVDLAFYTLLSGLIGARIIFIFTKLEDYLQSPLEVFMFWKGGLVWYGGFIGAALFIYGYCRRHQMNYFKIVDIFVPYMALAHASGRLGCLAAGCCFGEPTDVPWAIVFPTGSMAHQAQQIEGLVGFGDSALPIHPTQLYEAGAELAMCGLLLWMHPFKRFHGQIFLIWLSLYPVIRSVIEMYRGDKERGVYYLLSTSQYISILVALTAAVLFLYLRRQRILANREAGAGA